MQETPRITNVVRVYATAARAPFLRTVLGAACRATGLGVEADFQHTGVLVRRLRDEPENTRADLFTTFGPLGLEVSAREERLQSYAPPSPGSGGVLIASGQADRWHALDVAPFVAPGTPTLSDFGQLLTGDRVRRLAVPDPVRTEMGMLVLLATLDRARQVEGDPERAWQWWERLAEEDRLLVTEGEAESLAAVHAEQASHALLLRTPGPPGDPALLLRGLSPIPHPIALVATSQRAEPARALLAWLLGADGARAIADAGGLAAWNAEQNGLARVAESAQPFDVDWAYNQYRRALGEWERRGYSPAPGF